MRRFSVQITLGAALIAGLALPAGDALSQPKEPSADDIAHAKSRFEEGKKAEDDGKWAEALAAFKEVAEVRSTAQVRFQIAFCEEHLQHFIEARKGFEDAKALAEKDPDKAKEVLSAAPTRIEAVSARIAHLVISAEQKSIFRIYVDGTLVPIESFGKPIDVNPGNHAMEGERTDGKRFPIDSLTFGEGESHTIQLNAVDFEPPVEGKIDTPPPVTSSGTKIPAIVVGSVGIASLIGSGVFLGLRQSAIATVKDSCKDPDNYTGCNPRLKGTADNGKTDTYVSASLAAVGVVGLGVGAVLWFTVGKSSTKTSSNQGAENRRTTAKAGLGDWSVDRVDVGLGTINLRGSF